MSQMSENARILFESLKETALAMAPGLKNIGSDVSAEFTRVNTQATAELAGALFNGHAYVPYGPGQSTPSMPEHQQSAEAQGEHEPPAHEEQERSRER